MTPFLGIKNKTGISKINMYVKVSGKLFFRATGEEIDAKFWDNDKKLVSLNGKLSPEEYNRREAINKRLEQQKQELKDTIRELKQQHKPIDRDALKEAYQEKRDKAAAEVKSRREAKEKEISILQFIEQFIEDNIKGKDRKSRTLNTIKNYRTLLNHLADFQNVSCKKLSWDGIDGTFYMDFLDYLWSERKVYKASGPSKEKKLVTLPPLVDGSAGKYIRALKTIMKLAHGKQLHANSQYMEFQSFGSEPDTVYVNQEQINTLYNLELRGSEEIERDRFCLACCIGFRYSDYVRIKPEYISQDTQGTFWLKIEAQKTSKPVTIPLTPMAVTILKKYNFVMPKTANQVVNRMIKVICEKAGFTEKIIVREKRRRKTIERETRFCEEVSSHTPRRSWATNLYLDGFPVYDIMKVGNWKTESAFLRYLRADQLTSAKKLLEFQQKKEHQPILKVVG